MEKHMSYDDLVEEVQCFRDLLLDYARTKFNCGSKGTTLVTHCNKQVGKQSSESEHEDLIIAETTEEEDILKAAANTDASTENCSTSAQCLEKIVNHNSVISACVNAAARNCPPGDQNQRMKTCVISQSKEKWSDEYKNREVFENSKQTDVSTQTDLAHQYDFNDSDQMFESSFFLHILCHRCRSNNIYYKATCRDCYEYYETHQSKEHQLEFSNDKKRQKFHAIDFPRRTENETNKKRRNITVKEFFSELKRRRGFFKIASFDNVNACDHHIQRLRYRPSEVEDNRLTSRPKDIASGSFDSFGHNRKISTWNRPISRPGQDRDECNLSARKVDSWTSGSVRGKFYGTNRYDSWRGKFDSSRFIRRPNHRGKDKRTICSRRAHNIEFCGLRKSNYLNDFKKSGNIIQKNSSIEVEDNERKQLSRRNEFNFKKVKTLAFDKEDAHCKDHNGVEDCLVDQTKEKTQIQKEIEQNSQRQMNESILLELLSHNRGSMDMYSEPLPNMLPEILHNRDVNGYHEERQRRKYVDENSTNFKGNNDFDLLSLRKLSLKKTHNWKAAGISKLKSSPHSCPNFETTRGYVMNECIPHHRLKLAKNKALDTENIDHFKPTSLAEEAMHPVFARHSAVDAERVQCFDISVSNVISGKTSISEKIDDLCRINPPLSPIADSVIDSKVSNCSEDSGIARILTKNDLMMEKMNSCLPDEITQNMNSVTTIGTHPRQKGKSLHRDLINKLLTARRSDRENCLKAPSHTDYNASPISKQIKLSLREDVHSDRNNCNGDKSDNDHGHFEQNEIASNLGIGDDFVSEDASFEYDILRSPIVLNASDRVFDIRDNSVEVTNSNTVNGVAEASGSNADVSTILKQVRHQSDDILMTAMESVGLSQSAIENFLVSCTDLDSCFIDENILKPFCTAEDPDAFIDQILTHNTNTIASKDQEHQGDHFTEVDLSRYENNSILLSTQPNGRCEYNLKALSPVTGQLGGNALLSNPDFFGHDSINTTTGTERSDLAKDVSDLNKDKKNLEFQHFMESPKQESCTFTELLPLRQTRNSSVKGQNIPHWMNEPSANDENQQNVKKSITNPDENILDLVDMVKPAAEDQVCCSDLIVPCENEKPKCRQVTTNNMVTQRPDDNSKSTNNDGLQVPSDEKMLISNSNSTYQLRKRQIGNFSTNFDLDDTRLVHGLSISHLSQRRGKCIIARQLSFNGGGNDMIEDSEKKNNRRKRKTKQADDSLEPPHNRPLRVTRSKRSSSHSGKTGVSTDDKDDCGTSTKRNIERGDKEIEAIGKRAIVTCPRLKMSKASHSCLGSGESDKKQANDINTSPIPEASADSKIESQEIKTKAVHQNEQLLMKDYRRPRSMLRRRLKPMSSSRRADCTRMTCFTNSISGEMPAYSYQGDTNNNADDYDNSSTSSDTSFSLSECSSTMKSDSQRVQISKTLKTRFEELDRRYRNRYQRPTSTLIKDSLTLKPLLKSSKGKTTDKSLKSLKGKSKFKSLQKCAPKEQNCKKDPKPKMCVVNFVRRIQGSYGDHFPIASQTSKEKRYDLCNKYLQKYGIDASESKLKSGANRDEEANERQSHQLYASPSGDETNRGSFIKRILDRAVGNDAKSDIHTDSWPNSYELPDLRADGCNYNYSECHIKFDEGDVCKKSKSLSETNLPEDVSSILSSMSSTSNDISKLSEISETNGEMLKKKIEKIEQDFHSRFKPLFTTGSVDSSSFLSLESKQSSNSSKHSGKEKQKEKMLAILNKFENLVSHSDNPDEPSTPNSDSYVKGKLELPPISSCITSVQKTTDHLPTSSSMSIPVNCSHEMENPRQADVREGINDMLAKSSQLDMHTNELESQTLTKDETGLKTPFLLSLEEEMSEVFMTDTTSAARRMPSLPRLDGIECSTQDVWRNKKTHTAADGEVKLPFLSSNDNHGISCDDQCNKIILNYSDMNIHTESCSSVEQGAFPIPDESNEQKRIKLDGGKGSTSLALGTPSGNNNMFIDDVDGNNETVDNAWLFPTTSKDLSRTSLDKNIGKEMDAKSSGNSRSDNATDDVSDTNGLGVKDNPLLRLGLDDLPARTVTKGRPPPSTKLHWIDNKTSGVLSPILENPHEED